MRFSGEASGRWHGQVPGVLPAGERAVAQPDREATPGGVRHGERAPEAGRRSRHHQVHREWCGFFVSRGREAMRHDEFTTKECGVEATPPLFPRVSVVKQG